ncbi:MAG: hypothetical protein J7485_08165 [Sphingobium sp.]|nr:hypothetical protein [Sphingobium sp.]
MRLLGYLKGRLQERSSWAGIGAAIIGGSALPSPFSWLAVIAGVIATLVPTKGER